ncbi:MAG TPA: ABC transporter substrate-binding protein [Acidimicrobiales bacterium]|nr:ABC transporter substrate-binding protein [Acidimicrobiales bacterium]
MTRRQIAGTVAAVVLAVAGFGVSGASGSGVAHGVITFAETPGASPNYIFPFASCQYESTNNINQFQSLMFRPLYWFGLGGSAALVPALSPANSPHFSNGDRTVTVTLKGWRFADGQAVDARAVMFFLNMYRADPTAYCDYNAGFGVPDQVRTATGTANTVRITFVAPVNPNWLLYNYLSQITPLPNSWDRTSPTHSANCAGGVFGAASTKTSCDAVIEFLDSRAAVTSSFTGPLWQSGVDGPWRLSAFSAAGDATFVPNPHYSGPRKAQVRKVKEIAYATSQAEQADLKAGRLSIGYLDPSVLSAGASTPGRPGPNWAPLASSYVMTVGNTWSFNFAALNFSTADPKSAAINQLYIRQALQISIDQNTLIQTVFKGYATPVYSPLPPQTPQALARAVANPYPYSPAGAAALLASHGWTNVGGVLTCTSPGTGTGQCGSDIAAGYVLSFNVVVAGNSPSLALVMYAEAASWRTLGIGVDVQTASLANVAADCQGGTGFEICAWGTGWTYSPDYYPSGEALFAPGGGFNVGTYDDAKMTSLISASIHRSGTLSAYATYAAHQLPVLYQPQATVIQEVAKGLKSSAGFAPNPLGNFMPEYFHF